MNVKSHTSLQASHRLSRVSDSRRGSQEPEAKAKSTVGITLIELLLVVSIITILSVSTASFGLGFLFRNNLKNATNELVSSLRIAQINSMSGKVNSQWGVEVNATQIRMYAVSDPAFDQIFEIGGRVSITQDTVVFDQITGDADATATFTISGNTGDSNIVSVNEVGVVDIN